MTWTTEDRRRYAPAMQASVDTERTPAEMDV